MRARLFILTLVCFPSLLFFACSSEQESRQRDREGAELSRTEIKNPVDTAKVKKGILRNPIHTQGEVFFSRKLSLSFEVEGWLASEKLEDGQFVRSGEVLARLDTFQFSFQYEQARLAYETALTERTRRRIMSDIPESIKTSELVDSFRRRAKTIDLESGYNQAYSEFSYYQKLKQKYTPRAPFAGQVAGMDDQKLSFIPKGKEILQLIDPNSSRVLVFLTEGELSRLEKMKRAEVYLPSIQLKLQARLVSKSPLLNEQGLARTEWRLIGNTRRILEGMFAEIRILEEEGSPKLMIPRQALLKRTEGPFVFVWENPGLAAWRTVSIGDRGANGVEILEGLKEGEIVLIEGHDHLSHHAPIFVPSKNL